MSKINQEIEDFIKDETTSTNEKDIKLPDFDEFMESDSSSDSSENKKNKKKKYNSGSTDLPTSMKKKEKIKESKNKKKKGTQNARSSSTNLLSSPNRILFSSEKKERALSSLNLKNDVSQLELSGPQLTVQEFDVYDLPTHELQKLKKKLKRIEKEKRELLQEIQVDCQNNLDNIVQESQKYIQNIEKGEDQIQTLNGLLQKEIQKNKEKLAKEKEKISNEEELSNKQTRGSFGLILDLAAELRMLEFEKQTTSSYKNRVDNLNAAIIRKQEKIKILEKI
ncbi:hypothetical protein M0813_24408 [Anaeramoeba flamelloides]|uniref:Uncharacterized protein n=1 Tax=Anaeramoeba flamelloides TaxID=1746091 RepID=A0ABQ8Y5H0_9EUKA|nr:hypothetical protein M0813_24408 [Anaeramoeba flamelloides]